MYKFRSVRGRHQIDGKYVYTDSNMEADFLRELTANGFSGKLRRSKFGIGYGKARYTPDLELSILHDDMNRRALVEFKPVSTTQFEDDRRRAMLAASHFYKDAICLLYVKKTDAWFQLEPNGRLHEFKQPVPGGVAIGELSRPRLAIPIVNGYGRIYFVRPGNFILHKTVGSMEFLVKTFFVSSGGRRRGRK